MQEGVYIPQASPEDCQIECQNTAGCEYWTWDPGKLGSTVMKKKPRLKQFPWIKTIFMFLDPD